VAPVTKTRMMNPFVEDVEVHAARRPITWKSWQMTG
jgi:hypothetical protein